MNDELAAPDRRYGKLPSLERKTSCLESPIIGFAPLLRIKLYTFNQLPLCGFPTVPILETPPIVPPLGKFRAVLQIRALPILLYHRTPLSNAPTSNIIHGLSPQSPTRKETITSTCFPAMSADEKSIHCTTNQRMHIWTQRSVRCFLAQNFLPRVTSTEMLRVIRIGDLQGIHRSQRVLDMIERSTFNKILQYQCEGTVAIKTDSLTFIDKG
jgi:hypothetical protein